MTADKEKRVLLWLREDLRFDDHPALLAAVEQGWIYPVFVWDRTFPALQMPGGASRWWWHHALGSAQQGWKERGGWLWLEQGDPVEILLRLSDAWSIDAVLWNRAVTPHGRAQEARLMEQCDRAGLVYQSFPGNALWEPGSVMKVDGTAYRVFTPFFRQGCLGQGPLPMLPREAPRADRMKIAPFPGGEGGVTLEGLGLRPTIAWDGGLAASWDVSESGAVARMESFLAEGLTGYKKGRDFPCLPHISRLSPYLHSGLLSVRRLWYRVQDMLAKGSVPKADADHFCSELGWREFSLMLLCEHPTMQEIPLQGAFSRFPWRDDPEGLQAWQQGRTGYPLVDAAMRCLWATGFMHNRLRMVVASFLVKHLLIDWRHGERWFWDCLVDADEANNAAGWQWVAGCGADAAPYFRIFNPLLQSERYDPEGEFIAQYLPMLRGLAPKDRHAPWLVPPERRLAAGVALGENYPWPIVDMAAGRGRALAALASVTSKRYDDAEV